MVFKENRIVLTKDFPKIFRKYLKQKKISQNKFARQIGISGATLSQYISRQFTIPSSIFNKIALDLDIRNAEEYILKIKSYKEIRRSVAYLNPKFMAGWKKYKFKKNDLRTKRIARQGGLIG